LKLFTVTAIALTALLTACAAPQGGNATSDDLSTSETLFYFSHSMLPLPVSVNPGDQLYVSEIWGIEIVEILVDGQPVSGKPSYVLLDDPNIRPITVQSGTYIYNVGLSHMLFGKFSQPLDYDLVEYRIPNDAKELEIRYRLVPYDSDPDPHIYTLKARRVG